MITEVFWRVCAARDVAHYVHLTTKSYAEHMALGAFYDGIVDAVDALVESYIGQFGELPEFKPVDVKKPKKRLCDYLREEADWLEANRASISEDSDSIGNLVDALVDIYLSTIYKLERLS